MKWNISIRQSHLTYSSGRRTGGSDVFFSRWSIRSSFQARRLVCQTPRPSVVAGNIWKLKIKIILIFEEIVPQDVVRRSRVRVLILEDSFILTCFVKLVRVLILEDSFILTCFVKLQKHSKLIIFLTYQ